MLAASFDGQTTVPAEATQYHQEHYAKGEGAEDVVSLIGTHKVLDIAKKEVRVFECQRYVYEDNPVAVMVEDDFYHNMFGWREEDVEAVKTLPGMKVVETSARKVRITRVAGNVLLSDENPADLPIDEFNVVLMYAKKRKGRFWGKVRRAIDPQREMNKRASQTIDIGNKCAAYGWFIDANTFPDDMEKNKFIPLSLHSPSQGSHSTTP